jgi:AcrR family transcriptional regulator
MARRYELKRRQVRKDETRQRIVDAAVELHESLGANETSVAAIAERAGVGRLTVYRHFPDERALLTACTSHYMTAHPAPDARRWESIDDPSERLAVALPEIYAYYDVVGEMLTKSDRDAMTNPVLADVVAPYATAWEAIARVLVRGWDDPVRRAAVGHAIALSTWRSLTGDHGMSKDQAAALMAGMVRGAGSIASV